MILGNAIGIPFGWGSDSILLPSCARDSAISWNKDLDNNFTNYVSDSIGEENRDVYYGQYLTNTSGQINLYRTSGVFEYVDPSNGSLVTGVSIPANGLYTIPANGICDIGIYPVSGGEGQGLVDFKATPDDNEYIVLSSLPNLNQKTTLKFKMILDKESGYDTSTTSGQCLIIFYQVASPALKLMCSLRGDVFYASAGVALGQKTASLSGFSDQVIEVEVVREFSGSFWIITDIKFNDVSQSTTSVGGFSTSTSFSRIGTFSTSVNNNTLLSDATIWDIRLYDATDNLIHSWLGTGYNANTDNAWTDRTGSINGTVNGTPGLRNITNGEPLSYASFYPVCERAGTVLHDIMQDSRHISVSSPVWSESLYGSDYLNQNGFVTKTESDALDYDWETEVDGSNIVLDNNTLVPLGMWTYTGLYDNSAVLLRDSFDVILTAKINL